MNKTIIGAALSLAFIAPSHAFVPGGTDNLPWKASADIVGQPGSGIVVTDATYSQCVQQFQNAMDSHAYYHGYTFENIQYCSYKPFSTSVGGYTELELEKSLIELEDEYNIKEYIAKRDAVIETFIKENPPLPLAPKR